MSSIIGLQKEHTRDFTFDFEGLGKQNKKGTKKQNAYPICIKYMLVIYCI